VNESHPRMDVIPFESQHRFMATLNRNTAGQSVIYLKGAPETILDMCQWQQNADGRQPLDKTYWKQRINDIATNGQRSLALACKPAPGDKNKLDFEDVKSGMELLGLCGIIDPPREEATLAVNQCQQAGIRVKMITGGPSADCRCNRSPDGNRQRQRGLDRKRA